MSKGSEIFVSIASYRDAELLPTLLDMIHRAVCPEALHIAVCWQDNQDLQIFHQAGFLPAPEPQPLINDGYRFYYRGAVITIIACHYFISEGTGWARHRCETLYCRERYFLQIDAHCRFIPGWDQEMISLHQQLRRHSRLPVISAYPPGYRPGDNEGLNRSGSANRMVFREFSADGIPMLAGRAFSAEAPLRGSYLAAGFIFSDGSFVEDVPNDPQIFFAGEEISMAVRAFSCGYDIYHPHKVLLWHYYQRQECPKVWQDHNDSACQSGDIPLSWWQRDQISRQRIRTLLGLTETPAQSLSPYGYGQIRTLRQFEYHSGLNICQRISHPAVTNDTALAFFIDPPLNDAEWLNSLNTRYSKQITLAAEASGHEGQEYSYYRLAVFDQRNRLLFKTDLPPTTLPQSADDPPAIIDIGFNAPAADAPAVTRLSGWHPQKGWGPVTEQNW